MPSRKVLSIFIITFALVIAITLVAKPNTKRSIENSIKSAGIISKGPEIKTTASADWQDALSSINSGAITDYTKTNTPSETLTDEFSRSFMQNYLNLKQSGSLDSTSATKLVSDSEKFLQADIKNTYSLKNITISADNSLGAITKYGNALGSAFKTNKPKGAIRNELTIFKEMSDNKDDKENIELKNIAQVYKNLSLSLSLITVPSSFSSDHINMTNSINNISDAVKIMSQGFKDPLKSLQALSVYSQNFQTLMSSREKIQVNILKAGANYKQGDNAYFLYFGL